MRPLLPRQLCRINLSRVFGVWQQGSVLNKFYAGPGPHDILGGDGILGGRRVDWADQGETPPVSIDAGVQFLPREVIPKPELPSLPRSVAEATAECQTLYER